MDDKKIIIEDFANDEYLPATITSIEPLDDSEHYYKVKGNNENGEFEASVFVDGSSVLILPE